MSTFTWLLKGSKKNLAYSISYLQNKFNRNSRNEVLEYSNIVPSSCTVVVIRDVIRSHLLNLSQFECIKIQRTFFDIYTCKCKNIIWSTTQIYIVSIQNLVYMFQSALQYWKDNGAPENIIFLAHMLKNSMQRLYLTCQRTMSFYSFLQRYQSSFGALAK